MKSLVIDASVPIVALIRSQPEWEQAARILEDFSRGKVHLQAPDLIVYEVMNALDVAWRRVRALDRRAAREAADAFLKMRIELYPATSVALDTLNVSKEFEISAYDAAYIALARRLKTQVITLDRRLIAKVSKSGLARSIASWFERGP